MTDSGSKISIQNGKLNVPNDPVIPFIEGDGIGPDIWKAAVRVIDAAVEKNMRAAKLCTDSGTKKDITRPVTKLTSKPRVTPPITKAKVNSNELNGGISKSTMQPCTLPTIIVEEVFANEF